MPQVSSSLRVKGEALRDIRTRRGLTVKQLGRMTGRHPQSVRKLETSANKLASEVFAYQLANALKVDVSEFTEAVDDDGEPERNGAAA